jgi:predicted NAD/FAD-binding protein
MKVAIVGAGISGLTTAHLLDPSHEVTVFEAAGYAGGHTNTVRVDTPHETHQVDTGFIVFNDRNYPRFQRLLQRLGVRRSARRLRIQRRVAQRSVRQTLSPDHAVVSADARRLDTLQRCRARPGVW